MTRRVKLQRRERSVLLTLPGEDGRGQGFDADLRESLGGALELILSEPGDTPVLIRAEEGGWPVANDPATDYAEDTAPALSHLAGLIADAGRPVVVALSGRVNGGALALAQAASLRIAHDQAVFASPEYAVGLFPSGGGLVRLAQRVGAASALAFVTSRRDWSAQEAMQIGLCEALVSDEAVEEVALDFAQAVGGRGPGAITPKAVASEPEKYLEDLATARRGLTGGALAPAAQRAAEVAEAALLLPMEEALDYEAVAYADLAEGEVSTALRHVARITRRAAHLAALPEGQQDLTIARVALWNQPPERAAGLIAAGYEVVLGESDPTALEPAFTAIAEAQERAVQAGRLDPAQREADWDRLSAALECAALAGADLVVAAPRDGELPQIRAGLKPGAVLVLDGAAGPRDLALSDSGMVLELTAGAQAGQWLGAAGRVLQDAGALVIHAGPGLGVWLEAALFAAAERCVMAGAAPEAVDRAMVAFGFTDGPFVLADRIGIPAVMEWMGHAGHPPGVFFTFLDLEGQTGRAAGRGVYRYAEGAAPAVPSDQAAILAALRAEAGVDATTLPEREIVARICAELAGEGAMALQWGRAHRAGDIDLAAIALGFPAHRGGPMFQADRAGLLATRKRLRALAQEGAPAPVTLWDVLIRNGRWFSELDA
ncbi:enoyl-CoA hydratase-related protein [Sinirhodobacter sp. WL0062]|uniref:Enoyl-CoA hydratase-related protein n=1 Tax=Rhodobacter flavimaris TaxID=2907145 RepID=A0ABS8Z2B1_9RHOB|nr:enoyl-CoA hydratase-related protein [Sinirhodobacter sp. WL0062]MCE5974816.1 enoyl-CoA hydratase-related protein [Sinirhodobacter sp. WL0062]